MEEKVLELSSNVCITPCFEIPDIQTFPGGGNKTANLSYYLFDRRD